MDKRRQWEQIKMQAPDVAVWLGDLNKAFGKPGAMRVELPSGEVVESGQFGGQRMVFDGKARCGMEGVNKQKSIDVVCDGRIGPATCQSARTACNVYGNEVLLQICNARIAYYQAIVAHDPGQQEFLVG
jgi:hypothetical protein